MVEIPSKYSDGIKNMLILRKYRALFLLFSSNRYSYPVRRLRPF
jgi:hypothetical protein